MSGKVVCPFCNNKNTISIVCNDTIAPKESTYTQKCNVNKLKRGEAILSNQNHHYSLDIDGKVVFRRTYDRFCSDCNKPFYYISNMLVSDIKTETFIIESGSDRWKYIISFDKDNPCYIVEHNYITKEDHINLTPARKIKLLNGIKDSKVLNWKPQFGDNCFDYKIKWNIYFEFYDGQTIDKAGLDEYPEEWNIFIDPFIRVFKNKIFTKMK